MESHRFRDEVKLYKVIESCKTLAQCDVAHKYITAYNKYYGTCMLSAARTLSTREFMIFEAP